MNLVRWYRELAEAPGRLHGPGKAGPDFANRSASGFARLFMVPNMATAAAVPPPTLLDRHVDSNHQVAASFACASPPPED
jgi:hypothetical protein